MAISSRRISRFVQRARSACWSSACRRPSASGPGCRSAGAVEDDLQKCGDGQPALAETERQAAWEVHPTVEKDRGSSREPGKNFREIASLPKIVAWLKASWVPVAAVAVGALLGSLVYIESAYAYRFWIESKPLRGYHDYTRRSIADVDADWNLYKALEHRNLPLGRYSPVSWLNQALRAGLVAAADDVIDRYRNSSNFALDQFDWRKAQVCLQHAGELDGSDTT